VRTVKLGSLGLEGSRLGLGCADMFEFYGARFHGGNFERNHDLLDAVRAFPKEKGSTKAQLALAWVPALGEEIVPSAGTKRRSYLEKNAAIDVELAAGDLRRIDAASRKGAATRERLPGLSSVNR
jgi:aryl-alcohol dehydrogenase-like predicted oxidoreductase